MMTKIDATLPSVQTIVRSAEGALAERRERAQKIAVSGRFYWVKSEERLSLRMRLQKGDPHRAFEAEREAMRALAIAGAPVPPIVAEGPDWFAMPDSGRSLRELWRDPAVGSQQRVPAFEAAAKGLAGFHARGLSHGRPSIKDICWDGSRATFLDFERYAEKRNQPAGHAQDVVIMVFSAFADIGRATPETEALIDSYRAADPGGIWARAERLCRRLRFVDPLTWPIRRLRNSPELRAIPLTFAAFGVAR